MIGITDALAHSVGELVQKDVSIGLVEHIHILHRGEGNAFPHHGNIHGFAP